MAAEEAAIVGEPTFVAIVGDRFRCVETGHEMPALEKDRYASSKKCRDALFDRALGEGRPPLQHFSQCPEYKGKMVCKLTGAIVNKNEKAVWKHVLGKNFNKKLSAQEDEKKSNPEIDRNDEDMEFWIPPEVDADDEVDMVVEEPKTTKTKKKKQKKLAQDPVLKAKTGTQEETPKSSSKDESVKKTKKRAVEAANDKEKPNLSKSKEIKEKKNQVSGEKKQAAKKQKKLRREQGNDDDLNTAEEEETQIRMKRLALAVGPSSFASRKKKRKSES